MVVRLVVHGDDGGPHPSSGSRATTGRAVERRRRYRDPAPVHWRAPSSRRDSAAEQYALRPGLLVGRPCGLGLRRNGLRVPALRRHDPRSLVRRVPARPHPQNYRKYSYTRPVASTAFSQHVNRNGVSHNVT